MSDPQPTTITKSQDEFLRRVYAAQSPHEIEEIYNEWAASYDADMSVIDYVAPSLVVDEAVKHTSNVSSARFLDAGCGTGLCGVALSKHGVGAVDGVDYSSGMLQVAGRTGVYERLERVDLTAEVPKEVLADRVYNAVVCSGTLTEGHVGPVPVLKTFVRVVKKGGVIVATVKDSVWESMGFRVEVERLESDGLVEVLGRELVEYRKGFGHGGRLIVLKVG